MLIHEFLGRLDAAKWKILALAAVFLTVSLVAIFFLPRKQMVTLEIQPVPAVNILEYSSLNRLAVRLAARLNPNVGEEGDPGGNRHSFYTITNRSLMGALIERLRLLEVFEVELRKKALVRNANESEAKYRARLIKKLQLIRIFSAEDTNNWIVSYADNVEAGYIIEIFRAALKSAIDIVRKDYQLRIEVLIAQSEKLENERLSNLDSRIVNETALYKDKLSLEIRTLKEQAKIARSLEIEKNTLETLSVGNVATILSDESSNRPLFLRGYTALEREIELKSNRKADLYAPALIELRDERRKLTADQLVEFTKKELQVSPLYNGEFSPVFFNEASFVYHRPNYAIEILIAALMSLLLASAIVVSSVAARLWLEHTALEA
jgi:LPS O-antigen subunit length determinant protein (WzzB/FepE family)